MKWEIRDTHDQQKNTDHLRRNTRLYIAFIILKLCGLIVSFGQMISGTLSAGCSGARVICHYYMYNDLNRYEMDMCALINLLSIFERWNEWINDLLQMNNRNRTKRRKKSSEKNVRRNKLNVCKQLGEF